MQACVKYNTDKIIFSSSGGAIYGEAEEYPTTENYEPIPVSPYAITKFTAEKYLYFYFKQYGLNYSILRYSNVYGPRQDSAHESGVVTIFINSILKNTAVKIFTYPEQEKGND